MKKIITLDELSLKDITPINLLRDKNISAIIPALDMQLQEITRDINQVGIIYAIDDLDEKVLDFLAVQFHVDFYDLAISLQMKRDAIKNAILWHMKKGTSWAIIQALKSIGIDGEFLHWKDTGDEPYSFRIKAKITGDFYRTIGRDKIIKTIHKVVNESKAARSYFAGLETSIYFHEDLGLYIANFDLLAGHEKININREQKIPEAKIFTGLIENLEGNKKILPAREIIIDSKIFTGIIFQENFSLEIGVDLNIMHELLLQFENRIFSRLQELENNFNLQFKAQDLKMKKEFDEIKSLLEWKGEQDEI